MSALAQLSKFIDRFNTFIGYLCAFFVFSMVIVVFTVVVLRYGFNIGFIWMQEVYVWLHSFVFMLGAGFNYLANEHVNGSKIKIKSIVTNTDKITNSSLKLKLGFSFSSPIFILILFL